MKCTKCSALAVINLRYLEPLCNKCFCRLIERRIRKYARVNGLFKKNDVILAVDYLSRFLVKRVIMNLPVIILFREFAIRDVIDNHKVIREFVEENKVNKIAVSWTMDNEVSMFLDNVFNNRTINKEDEIQSIVKILLHVTNQEAVLYARIMGIEFTPEILFPEPYDFIKSLEKYHPDTKFGLLKSRELIGKLR